MVVPSAGHVAGSARTSARPGPGTEEITQAPAYNVRTMNHPATDTTSIIQGLPEGVAEQFMSLLRAHGATRAHLFGSVAAGTARPDSDLDLLVTFGQPLPLFR